MTERAAGAMAPAAVQVSQATLIALREAGSRLPLEALRVRARKGGQYLSHFKGRGMEFDETRLYQPGDDPRNIDWRVTARSGKAYTKLFREERERPVFCWVDQRSTMQFATRGVFKAVQAAQLATLLGWAAVARGDRFGGFVFNDQARVELRPILGRRAVLRMIHQLRELQSQPGGTHAADLMNKSLAGLRRVAHPGSFIALIGDFNGFDEAGADLLAGLARSNDVLVMPVVDALERELPQDGDYPVIIGQRAARLVANRRKRADWRDAFEARMQMLASLATRSGVRLHPVMTDDDPLRVLQQLLGKAT
ncbi:MAG: DUF58 domain-containing protein [Pseudomonadota bacterium]